MTTTGHPVSEAPSGNTAGLPAGGPECPAIRDASDPVERVLIVAREFTRGGAAYLALRHARRLNERFAIDVLVTGPADDDFLGEFPAGVSIYRLGEFPSRPEGSPLRFLHQLVKRHQAIPPFQRSYRAVLATSIFPDWEACAITAAVQTQRRLIFLVDEGLVRYPGLGPPERSIVERCILAADLVLPVSRRLWQRMAEHCPPLRDRPWQSLRPPIEVEEGPRRGECPAARDRYWGRSGGPHGRPVHARQTGRPVPASPSSTQESRAQISLVRCWVRPEEQEIRRRVHELDMDEDFILLGYQDNLYAWMKHCDVFALFSSSEGCPTVVLEALSLGCPVVMTDVNGADEIIDHGRTGLVVANDEYAIATGLGQRRDEGLRHPVSPGLCRSGWFAEWGA